MRREPGTVARSDDQLRQRLKDEDFQDERTLEYPEVFIEKYSSVLDGIEDSLNKPPVGA